MIRIHTHRSVILKLQDIEHKVADSLSFVRCSINNFRPIHRLPTEVLGIVFRYALPTPDGGFQESGCHDPDIKTERRARAALTHVCRRWRAVALDMAALWTVIDASAGPSVLPYFERSGNMPLHVFARYPLDNTTETPLASQGSRIRDLFLEFPREHRSIVPTELSAFLPHSPNLECLAIATRCRTFEDGRPIVDLAQRPQLFPCPPPRLTMLILQNQSWFPAVPYDRLTHLHISQGTPIDIRSLLTLLGHCTALEKAVFVDVYIANARQVPEDFRVELPRLKLLALAINFSRLSMRYLLRGLVLPPTVVVRITGSEAVRALAGLQPFPALPFAAGFDTLIVDHRSGCWNVQAAGPTSGLLLGCGTSTVTYMTAEVLASLIPFANIKRLIVRSDRAVVTFGVLSVMPSLSSLCIIDHDRPDPLRADDDVQPWHVGAALRKTMARFPDLSELEVWSKRSPIDCANDIPNELVDLRRLTIHHMHLEEDVAHSPIEMESVRNRFPTATVQLVEAKEGPNVDLPGIRPAHHANDW